MSQATGVFLFMALYLGIPALVVWITLKLAALLRGGFVKKESPGIALAEPPSRGKAVFNRILSMLALSVVTLAIVGIFQDMIARIGHIEFWLWGIWLFLVLTAYLVGRRPLV